MANFGFSSTPTATALYKIVNVNDADWSDDQRLNCTLASAIGDLPDSTAHAKFLALLNTLGIVHSGNAVVNAEKTHSVDTFTLKGTKVTKLSDVDKRKKIASVMWPTLDVDVSSKMLDGVKGDALDQMMASAVKEKGDKTPFVMYRIRIGAHVFYRVTNDVLSAESLVGQGINYLVEQKKINGI